MQTSRAKVYPVNEVKSPDGIIEKSSEDAVHIKDLSVIKPRYVEILYLPPMNEIWT